jgi:hypothetical protein
MLTLAPREIKNLPIWESSLRKGIRTKLIKTYIDTRLGCSIVSTTTLLIKGDFRRLSHGTHSGVRPLSFVPFTSAPAPTSSWTISSRPALTSIVVFKKTNPNKWQGITHLRCVRMSTRYCLICLPQRSDQLESVQHRENPTRQPNEVVCDRPR